MKFEIKNRWTGNVQFTADIDCAENTILPIKIGLAVKWAIKNNADLRDADLRDADLRDANLRAANLRDADLCAANLCAANLRDADLRAANLRDADLGAANLRAADLRAADLRAADLGAADLRAADLRAADLRAADLGAADLRDADLGDADLRAADLGDADLGDAKNLRLPTGETWKEYLEQTVPALLIAGGKSFDEVATEKHWNCHSWDNCPMAAAFGVNSEEKCPLLLRPRVRQFVQFFDAHQIKLSDIRK